jgi:hypothetical protein
MTRMKIFCWRFLKKNVDWTNICLLCKRAISFPGKVLLVKKEIKRPLTNSKNCKCSIIKVIFTLGLILIFMVFILPFDLYIKFTKMRINFLNLRMNSQKYFHSFYLFVLDYGLPKLWSHRFGDYPPR